MRALVLVAIHDGHRDGDDSHTRGERRFDTGGGVLEYETALGFGAEISGRQEKDIRGRLCTFQTWVVATDDDVEGVEPVMVSALEFNELPRAAGRYGHRYRAGRQRLDQLDHPRQRRDVGEKPPQMRFAPLDELLGRDRQVE